MSILFASLRTRRLAVQLRELAIGDTRTLLTLPEEMAEAGATEFLRIVAAGAEMLTQHHVTDPRAMTVQERFMLIGHYLAHVAEGGSDFAIGDARFSSFVMPGKDWNGKPASVGPAPGGRACAVWPLFGWAAEVLERISATRGDWQIGAMAAQMLFDKDPMPDGTKLSTVEAIEWVRSRRDKLLKVPESEFEQYLVLYDQGCAEVTHFFTIAFQDTGAVAMPTEAAQKEAGADGIAPARFLFTSAVGPTARYLFGRDHQPGNRAGA